MVKVSKTSFKEPPLIKYKGLYDFEGLYKMVWQWLIKHRYRVHERRYKDKMSTPLGTELEIDIDGEKKINEYIKYIVHVYYHVFDFQEIDVMDNGNKKKMTRGRIIVQVTGEYILDYNDRFKGNAFLKLLGKGYNKIEERTIELKYEDVLHYHVYDLIELIRSFLNMQHAKEATVDMFDGKQQITTSRFKMAEKKTLIDAKEIKYSGLMNVRELLHTIDTWLEDHGYGKDLKKSYEEVHETGKQITLELTPYKKASEYAKYRIRINLILRNLKDVEIEKAGVKTKLSKGDAHIIFDTFLETDYENSWETKPTYYFLRMVFDKYVYKQQTKQFEKEAVSDTLELIDHIKAFLNLHRYL